MSFALGFSLGAFVVLLFVAIAGLAILTAEAHDE